MKLAVVTPCLYPDTERIHFLRDSAAYHGVGLHALGLGETFGNWRQMTLDIMVPKLRALILEGYTHMLYLDGNDTFILGTVEEFEYKFRAFKEQVLVYSAQSLSYPSGITFPPILGLRKYPNAGCCMGLIEFWCAFMETIANVHENDGNPQSWLMQEWSKNYGVLELDSDCTIFQTMPDPGVTLSPLVALNRITGTHPCVLHFPGGYSDPKTGRDERIYPYWRQIYG